MGNEELPDEYEVFLNTKRRRVFGYPVLTMDELHAFMADGRGLLEDHHLDRETHTVEIVTSRCYGLPVITEMEARRLEDAVETLSKFIKPAKKVGL